MKQQVNLFQPRFRRRKPVFSARAMVQIMVLVGFGMGLVYGWGQWRLTGLRAELDRLAAREAQAVQRLQALHEQYPETRPDTRLAAEITALAREVAHKERLLAALGDDGAFGNTRGFSAYLEGLARQVVDGAWLTQFAIGNGGRALALVGQALAPERVPAYVQRLAREEVFAGRVFSELTIERVADDPRRVAFALRTQGAAAPEAAP